MATRNAAWCLLLLTATSAAAQTDDILIADFEGNDYGAWKTTGTAFGNGPARGTLPGQMPVSGFLGQGLVNSFVGGDASVGTLTSPPFTLERDHINFLVGGGGHAGQTCVNLIVKDKVVRTATGPNNQAGGSEQLDWHSWNVRALRGQQAVIQIVDEHRGGWGHINVDHIVQSDRPKGSQLAQREIEIAEPYLHLPVKNGAPKRRMKFLIDGQTVREFEIELAGDIPDFFVFSDVTPFRGKKLTLEVMLAQDSKALDSVRTSSTLPAADEMYDEKLRPQFHFSSRRGWLNDPNGLVHYKGEYHLFYQHNPYGWSWGNMHWGHAVSKDLIHWRELPVALYPQRFGDWCFSGSAVVDRHNTAGFKTGDEDVLVAAYTSTGRGECIVYSNDRGRTWTEYQGNPVVKHRGRDPRLLWHEPSKRWIMAVYNEDHGKTIAFHSSPNLKDWTFHSRIGEFYECPDLFELPIDGNPQQTKWVLYGADGRYLLGHFDGQRFGPDSKLHQVWYGNMYAAQTFSNVPDGRCIQIGWARVAFPGMPFNQQMTIPCELTLRKTEDGVRMFVQPVKEIRGLWGKGHGSPRGRIKPGVNVLEHIKEDLLEIKLTLVPDSAKKITLRLHGADVIYDAVKQELTCRNVRAPLPAPARLHILVDRGSIEIFGNDGRVALSVGTADLKSAPGVSLTAEGGVAEYMDLSVNQLRSAWKK